jgi:hypothetical protein
MSLGSIRIGKRYSKRNRLDNRVDLIDNDLTYSEILAAEEEFWKTIAIELANNRAKRQFCSDYDALEHNDDAEFFIWLNYENSIRRMFRTDNRLAVEIIKRRSDIYWRSLAS